MRDESGYFSRYQQCLYFARIQTDLLEAVETGNDSASSETGEGPGVASAFDAQRHRCFGEAVVSNLYRALCFLACAIVPQDDARSILKSPRRLNVILDEALASQPSAALHSMCQELQNAEADSPGSHAGTLHDLISLYPLLWIVAPAKTDASLIAVRQLDFSAEQCRNWLAELTDLGRMLAHLETEC